MNQAAANAVGPPDGRHAHTVSPRYRTEGVTALYAMMAPSDPRARGEFLECLQKCVPFFDRHEHLVRTIGVAGPTAESGVDIEEIADRQLGQLS